MTTITSVIIERMHIVVTTGDERLPTIQVGKIQKAHRNHPTCVPWVNAACVTTRPKGILMCVKMTCVAFALKSIELIRRRIVGSQVTSYQRRSVPEMTNKISLVLVLGVYSDSYVTGRRFSKIGKDACCYGARFKFSSIIAKA